jgi:urease gamma subunit
MTERTERAELLRKFLPLKWTSEQELKIGEAFALLDEVMMECMKDGNKSKEINAIARPLYTIERVVTAFAINRMIKREQNEPRE